MLLLMLENVPVQNYAGRAERRTTDKKFIVV